MGYHFVSSSCRSCKLRKRSCLTHVDSSIIPSKESDVCSERDLSAADVFCAVVGVGAGVEAVVAIVPAEGEQVAHGDGPERKFLQAEVWLDHDLRICGILIIEYWIVQGQTKRPSEGLENFFH